jgi:hypothetical protein
VARVARAERRAGIVADELRVDCVVDGVWTPQSSARRANSRLLGAFLLATHSVRIHVF